MSTALSAIKLVTFVTLGIMYFAGQGWLVICPLLHGSFIHPQKRYPLQQEFPLLMVIGLITNYGITLIIQTVTTSLILGSVFSVIGISLFFVYLLQNHTKISFSSSAKSKLVLFATLSLLIFCPILIDPLSAWDARMIWFFHAKMIYYANSIGLSAGWQHALIGSFTSHKDYPNLVSLLAAQIPTVSGFWNEYLPKLSLFYIFIPVICWLLSFARKSFSYYLLLFLTLFSLGSLLWNGYMDGYLALYFCVALLLMGRYIKSSQKIDLISSVSCLLFLLYIKNEGILAILAAFCSIAISFFIWKKKLALKSLFCDNWKPLLLFIIMIFPFCLWTYYKHRWHITNDLEIGTSDSVNRIITRFQDGSIKVILKTLYSQIHVTVILLGLVLLSLASQKRPFVKESFPAIISAELYCIGIFVIYLLTPHDLQWHLSTSVSRTMLTVNECLFVGIYYGLNSMENSETISRE